MGSYNEGGREGGVALIRRKEVKEYQDAAAAPVREEEKRRRGDLHHVNKPETYHSLTVFCFTVCALFLSHPVYCTPSLIT